MHSGVIEAASMHSIEQTNAWRIKMNFLARIVKSICDMLKMLRPKDTEMWVSWYQPFVYIFFFWFGCAFLIAFGKLLNGKRRWFNLKMWNCCCCWFESTRCVWSLLAFQLVGFFWSEKCIRIQLSCCQGGWKGRRKKTGRNWVKEKRIRERKTNGSERR